MKNIPLILFILLILLATACGSKKNVTTSVTKVTDTVFIKTETVTAPKISEAITIKELCDSVTNQPVQFRKVFVIKNDTIEVETIDNQLRFKYQVAQSVIKQKDSIVRAKDKLIQESSEKVKYRTNWKWILGCLVIGFAVGFFRPWRWIV